MKTKKGVVTMKVKDGFKFGVGFFLGTSTIAVLTKLIAEIGLSEKKPTNTEKDEKPEEVTE